jgi:hypothetical protein
VNRAVRLFESALSAISENRKTAVFCTVILVFFFSSLIFLGGAERRLAKKRAALASFETMRIEYAKGIFETGAFRDRLGSNGAGSALDAVQAAAIDSGIRKNISQLKPFEPAPVKGYRQNGAELKAEGVDIGQVVQFLYRLENGSRALLTDEFQMKSSFEDPNKLEVRARIRFVSRE